MYAMYIFCNDHHFSQANGWIATKLAHDGLQVSLRPRCAQGQGQRSRDTGTLVVARKSLLEYYWDTWNYSLFTSSLQSTISCISVQFARWQHDCGRSLLSTIALFTISFVMSRVTLHCFYRPIFCFSGLIASSLILYNIMIITNCNHSVFHSGFYEQRKMECHVLDRRVFQPKMACVCVCRYEERFLQGAFGQVTYELIFFSVQESLYGEYTCNIVNNLGIGQHAITLARKQLEFYYTLYIF